MQGSKGSMERKTDDKQLTGLSMRKAILRSPWQPLSDATAPDASLTIPAHRPVSTVVSTAQDAVGIKKAASFKTSNTKTVYTMSLWTVLAAVGQGSSGHLDNIVLYNEQCQKTLNEFRSAPPCCRLQILYNNIEPQVRALHPFSSHKITLSLLQLPLHNIVAAFLWGPRLEMLVARAAAVAGLPRPGQDKDEFFDDFLVAYTPGALKRVLNCIFEGTAVAKSHSALVAEAVAAMLASPKQELLGLVGTAEARKALVACIKCRARNADRFGGA